MILFSKIHGSKINVIVTNKILNMYVVSESQIIFIMLTKCSKPFENLFMVRTLHSTSLHNTAY